MCPFTITRPTVAVEEKNSLSVFGREANEGCFVIYFITWRSCSLSSPSDFEHRIVANDYFCEPVAK